MKNVRRDTEGLWNVPADLWHFIMKYEESHHTALVYIDSSDEDTFHIDLCRVWEYRRVDDRCPELICKLKDPPRDMHEDDNWFSGNQWADVYVEVDSDLGRYLYKCLKGFVGDLTRELNSIAFEFGASNG